jgi:putative transposase
VGTIFVGNPDGVQRKDFGRVQNQRMSQWEFGRDINYLMHKSELNSIECFIGTERGTSGQCPQCGHKQKVSGRRWHCRACGFRGHRDIVGSVNMHKLAFGTPIAFPAKATYLRAGAVRLCRGANNLDRSKMIARSSSPDAGQGRKSLLSGVGRNLGQRTCPCRVSDSLGSIPLTSEAHPL